jgi:ABC-type branched-subunit amino acid transport system substrate-binding protein
LLTRRQFGLGALGGAGAIAAPWIGPARAQAKTVRIGMIQSMSGNLSAYAQEGQPAFEHVVKLINRNGGIKSLGGAKIEIVLADDSSQPARTAAEARRLATEENVPLIVGTILSAQMLAVTPVLDEIKTPTLSIWAGGSRSPYMYSLGFPYDRGYAQTMADFAIWLRDKQGMKLKTVVPAYSNYEAGQQTNKFLTEKLKAAGFDIIGEAPLDTKAQDQSAAMIRIRSLKPDLVMGLVTPRDGILLHQARYNLNYHGSIFAGGTGGYSDLSLWRDLSPEIAGKVLTQNLFAMTAFSEGVKMDSLQTIVTELRNEAGMKDQVGQGAIQAAQAARVVQRVLEKAGSTDREAILKAFGEVEIPFGDPDLYVAKAKGLRFGEDRMLTDGSALFVQWTPERKQEVVFPDAFAQAKPRPRA